MFQVNSKYLENIEDLANAVVQLACKDYKNAYKVKNKGALKTLNNFFYGEIFELYTLGRIDPEFILREIRYQVDSRNEQNMNRSRTSGLFKSKPRRVKSSNTD